MSGQSTNTMRALFSQYPKTRPHLPDNFQKIYAKEYESNREGNKGLSKIVAMLEAWMHRKVAANSADGDRVLEIGAGTLNHLRFESDVDVYDIVEPMEFLFKERPELAKVNKIYEDINDIPTSSEYDRIISIAVLEHVTNLPALIAKSALMTKNNGIFQAGIPAEGGALWGLAWRLTTGISFRLKHGLDYSILMRHEHVNNADEIKDIIRYFFDEVSVKKFPIPFKHLCFYEYIEATKPKKMVASKFN